MAAAESKRLKCMAFMARCRDDMSLACRAQQGLPAECFQATRAIGHETIMQQGMHAYLVILAPSPVQHGCRGAAGPGGG